MTDTVQLDRMADAWAKRFRMLRCDKYSAPGPLQSLFLPGRHDEVTDLLYKHSAEAFLDHARAFRTQGARRCSAVVSAPYEYSIFKPMSLTPAEKVDKIHTIAEELGLRVRVGHPADRIYVGTGDWPTLPVVWWDPTLFAMLYPQLEDKASSSYIDQR